MHYDRTVFVRTYTRIRWSRVERVRCHYRRPPRR